MASSSSIPCTSHPSFASPRALALANNPELSSLPSRFWQVTVLPKIGVRVRSSTLGLRVLCLQRPKAAIIKGNSWDKLVLNSDIPVLVEFYASWCGPCRMVQRVVDELATEYSGRIKCFIIHADNDLEVAENYDIKAVPVVLLFKNGERRDAIAGTMPKEFYVAAIERLLES